MNSTNNFRKILPKKHQNTASADSRQFLLCTNPEVKPNIVIIIQRMVKKQVVVTTMGHHTITDNIIYDVHSEIKCSSTSVSIFISTHNFYSCDRY